MFKLKNKYKLKGDPIRKNYLPYGKQSISNEDINSVVEVLKSDFLTTGPIVNEFEKKIADYVGARYAVAVSNGTAALHMACFVAGIVEGDEVIVSSMTFAASANAVLYCGGTPVFADIDTSTYNVDINDIKNKITERTKALIVVDYTGQSVDMDEIMTLAKKENLIVIEDAAHALGSEYKGRKVGSQADMVEFSLHPVKPITTGEGGIITTNCRKYYEKMLMFRSHGITKKTEDFMRPESGEWYHEQQFLGFNYRLTDIQCALGLSQLNKLDDFIYKRRKIVKRYNLHFSRFKELVIPNEPSYSNSGWHIYVLQLNIEQLNANREDVFNALQSLNIGVNVHYLPVYLHPYYKSIGYEEGLCKNAEWLYNRIITLPLFPKMNEEDVEDVIEAVTRVINYYRK